MSEVGPESPGVGRHRAPAAEPKAVLQRLLAPIVAIAVVAAAIVVLVVLRGHSGGNGPGAGVIVASTPPSLVSPTLSSSPSASSSATTSPTPGDTVTETHAPPTPSLRPTHQPPAWRTAMALVRVYNSTHITGIAHQAAAEIAARGWTVPDVGNVQGISPETTVYYSPDARAAAVHLAHEFSGIRRIRPNTEAKISYRGLTLVLTADWHS